MKILGLYVLNFLTHGEIGEIILREVSHPQVPIHYDIAAVFDYPIGFVEALLAVLHSHAMKLEIIQHHEYQHNGKSPCQEHYHVTKHLFHLTSHPSLFGFQKKKTKIMIAQIEITKKSGIKSILATLQTNPLLVHVLYMFSWKVLLNNISIIITIT
jgi:hypothetical protein